MDTKRRAGRPSKGDSALTQKLYLKVSKRDIDKLEDLAKQANYSGSINVFTRDLLLDALNSMSSAGAVDPFKRGGNNET